MVGLVVKVEGAECLLTETSGLPQCKIWFWGSEISSTMAITPWTHSGGLREAAMEQQHNCGMGRDLPGGFLFWQPGTAYSSSTATIAAGCRLGLKGLLQHSRDLLVFSCREFDERISITFITSCWILSRLFSQR